VVTAGRWFDGVRRVLHVVAPCGLRRVGLRVDLAAAGGQGGAQFGIPLPVEQPDADGDQQQQGDQAGGGEPAADVVAPLCGLARGPLLLSSCRAGRRRPGWLRARRCLRRRRALLLLVAGH
jgi:hypothetical protein